MRRGHKKIGVVLGSGGARGWAHIGVLQALQDMGVRIDGVVGTSMGALVGAAFASGKLDSLQEIVLQLDWKQVIYYFTEFNIPISGLVDGDRVAKFLRQHVSASKMEDLLVPFKAVATDIRSGQKVVLDKGDVIDAVRASIAVPGIFTPVRKGNLLLVDGGLVDPVPVQVARDMGMDFVIAVNVTHGLGETAPEAMLATKLKGSTIFGKFRKKKDKIAKLLDEKIGMVDFTPILPIKKWVAGKKIPGMFDILGNSIRIMEAHLASSNLENFSPDILIKPDVVSLNFMEYHRAAPTISAGYAAAVVQAQANALPLKKILGYDIRLGRR